MTTLSTVRAQRRTIVRFREGISRGERLERSGAVNPGPTPAAPAAPGDGTASAAPGRFVPSARPVCDGIGAPA